MLWSFVLSFVFLGALRTLIMSRVEEEDSEVLHRFCIVGLY
jgi:hypothetical protein